MFPALPSADVPPPSVAEGELWSLREDAYVQVEEACLVVRSRWGGVRIARPSPVLREALRRMELGPGRLENMPGTDDLAERVRLLVELQRLGGLVVRSVGADDGRSPLLSAVPTTADAHLRPVAVPDGRLLRLSRFAAQRSTGNGSVLESPLSPFRVVFTRPETGWLIASLGTATTLRDVVECAPVPERTARLMLSYLVATGMVAAASAEQDGSRFPEDTDPVLRTWSHHDLMFHWSSRPGFNDGVFGATYSLRGVQEQPPALKPLPAGPRIALPPAGEGREQDRPGHGMSLTGALERRASVRRHGSRALTVRQLGELLHLALGIRPHRGADGAADTGGADGTEGAEAGGVRPFPTGGACYELEFYLSVARCEGLEPGIYYYAPAEHCLVRLPADEDALHGVLADGQAGAGMSGSPDVLLTMTARFARVSWKYSGIAYALTLKHVGVVQQTLYLLTAALGLAGCAIGTGDTERSARAFGLDWREESAVGEFVLGSLPDE